jgi:ABC-type branched-subunit amino acid transport system ATPase component
MMPLPMPTPEPVLIDARGLTKRFAAFTAVDAIDVDVAPGEAFGFLGPNGAAYPPALEAIVRLTPLYQGVGLIRGLATGAVAPDSLLDVVYLAVMDVIGLAIASPWLGRLLLT